MNTAMLIADRLFAPKSGARGADGVADVCYVPPAYRGGPKFKGLFGLAQRRFGFPTPLGKRS
jgi:hypothetical protein